MDPSLTEYKVVTLGSDTVSNAFYVSCGFSASREFVHHGNTMQEYRRRIDPSRQQGAV
jgi:hypothetical protein